MEAIKYKISWVCENPIADWGYYQLVRISDNAILDSCMSIEPIIKRALQNVIDKKALYIE